jgi:phosphoribosylformimino-5-aminoimidazole carboxamide ribonucleotide (ProFAR) isomerase
MEAPSPKRRVSIAVDVKDGRLVSLGWAETDEDRTAAQLRGRFQPHSWPATLSTTVPCDGTLVV